MKLCKILMQMDRDIGASIVTVGAKVELSITLMATDAIALIQNLGWKSVDMLGFSMGGVCVCPLNHISAPISSR